MHADTAAAQLYKAPESLRLATAGRRARSCCLIYDTFAIQLNCCISPGQAQVPLLAGRMLLPLLCLHMAAYMIRMRP